MDPPGWWLLLGALGCCVLALGVPRRAVALGFLAGGLTVLAFGHLAWAFVTSDYRLVEVADYSRRAVVWPLRLSGAWAGMDGSLLLFTTLLAIVAAVGARRATRTGRVALAALAGSFVALSSIAANPFERLSSPPLDGGGMTPILEFPAMVVHPPLLYLGLVLCAIPWADAVALAFAPRRPAGEWGRLDGSDGPYGMEGRARARRWSLASWTALTAGLVLGSLWAYVEVGWGGFWGWDPVENAALLPWFALLAGLHVRPARITSARVEVALAGLPFVAVLLAATLTRSGWTSSVHAFAEGRVVGWWLLGLTAAAALALAVAAARQPGVRGSDGVGAGRDWRVVGTVVLGLATGLVVGLGTVWPFLADLVRARPRATDGAFYAAWAGPVAIVACGLLSTVALSPPGGGWHGSAHPTRGRLWRWAGPGAAGVLALALALAAGFDLVPSGLLVAAGATGAAAVLVAARQRRWAAGATVAHLGLVVLVLGLAGSTAARDVTATLQPGQALQVGGYRVVSLGASADAGPPGSGGRVVADLVLTRGSGGRALRPQLVAYPERARLLAETAGRQGLLDDVRVALRSADDDGRVTIEVHVRPLQGAVWFGGALLVAGGGIALLGAGARAARRRDALIRTDADVALG